MTTVGGATTFIAAMDERGTVRPASDDWALHGDLDNRGKLLPCPACGDAPDHRPDDQRCVERRVLAVREARKAHEALAALDREFRKLDDYMVD